MLNPVESLVELIVRLGFSPINVNKLKDLCDTWKIANQKYFQIYFEWQNINNALDSNTDYNLDSITSLNDQGYINYCIEKKYNVTIPVYDYRNWFKTTDEIVSMLKILKNDSNS